MLHLANERLFQLNQPAGQAGGDHPPFIYDSSSSFSYRDSKAKTSLKREAYEGL